MYPSDELTYLAMRKHLLVTQSTLLRAQCVTAANELAPPIQTAEGWVGTAKKLFPYLRLASLFFGRKKKRQSPPLWSMALKWAPTLFQVFQSFKRSPREDRRETPKPSEDSSAL